MFIDFYKNKVKSINFHLNDVYIYICIFFFLHFDVMIRYTVNEFV